VKGRIESEPLAWGNAVYVQSCDNDVHWLTAFSVANGKVLGRKSWRSGAPLLASVWNGIVVVRAAPSRVEAVRLKTDGFLQVTAIDAAAPVHDLLLYRRELYLRVGDQVARYELGKRTPTWTAAERCRGRLALRGAYVYGVEYERDGAYIRSWRRADALSPDRRLIGHHDGKVPDASDVSPHGEHGRRRPHLREGRLRVPLRLGTLDRRERGRRVADGLDRRDGREVRQAGALGDGRGR
jgi:hypothetical protein